MHEIGKPPAPAPRPVFLGGRWRGRVVRTVEIGAGLTAAVYLTLVMAGFLGARWVPSLRLPGVGEILPQGNEELRPPAFASGGTDDEAEPGQPAAAEPAEPSAASDAAAAPPSPRPIAEGPDRSAAQAAAPASSARPDPAPAPRGAADAQETPGNSADAPRAHPSPPPQSQGPARAADPEEKSGGRARRGRS